jgi:hypothetical protein
MLITHLTPKIRILYQYIGKNFSNLLNKYFFFLIIFFFNSCVQQTSEVIKVINIYCKTNPQNIFENNVNFIIKSNSDFLKSHEKINNKKFNNSNLIVQASEKRSGGYSLHLNRIVGNKLYFFETPPFEKTATITVINYPYCEIELNKISENLEIIFEK